MSLEQLPEVLGRDLTAESARGVEFLTGSGADAHLHQKRGNQLLLIGRGCFFVSGYLATMILARRLGTTEYGIYGVIVSQLLWLEMVTNAGLPGATAKLMAGHRHNSDEVEASARSLLIGVSLLLFAACWILAPHAAKLMRIPQGERLFRIAIVDLPFAALYASYEGILYGRGRFGVIAGAQAAYGLTRLAAVVALIALGFSVERALITTVISTFVVCVALVVSYPPRGFAPTRHLLVETVAVAAPMGLYLILAQVTVNLDLWSLKSFWEGGGEVVGQYVASVNLAKILTLIPAVQAGVLFTSVAWAIALRDQMRARRHVNEATRFVVIIAAAACVILGLDASEVLSALFSGAYAGGESFLRLLLVGFSLYALLDAFCSSLMAAGSQWRVAGALIATVPFVWLCNYLLIPRFGPSGAATSMLLGVGLCAGLTGAMAYRRFGSVIQSSLILRVGVAALVTGVVSRALRVHGPVVIIKITALGVLYLFVLCLLGEVSTDDFRLRVEETG